MKIARESWLLIGIGVADLISTLFFVLCRGGKEANPLMNFFLAQSVVAFIMAKILLFMFAPLAVLEWARRRRPQFVRAMTRLAIFAYLGAYGVVVWRINHPSDRQTGVLYTAAQLDRMSDAQLAAVEEWSASKPTPADFDAIRTHMVQD